MILWLYHNTECMCAYWYFDYTIKEIEKCGFLQYNRVVGLCTYLFPKLFKFVLWMTNYWLLLHLASLYYKFHQYCIMTTQLPSAIIHKWYGLFNRLEAFVLSYEMQINYLRILSGVVLLSFWVLILWLYSEICCRPWVLGIGKICFHLNCFQSQLISYVQYISVVHLIVSFIVMQI